MTINLWNRNCIYYIQSKVACIYSNYRQDFFVTMYLATEAVVGFEMSAVTVSEDQGMLQVCVKIFSPDIDCQVVFPFDLIVTASDGTAGKL